MLIILKVAGVPDAKHKQMKRTNAASEKITAVILDSDKMSERKREKKRPPKNKNNNNAQLKINNSNQQSIFLIRIRLHRQLGSIGAHMRSMDTHNIRIQYVCVRLQTAYTTTHIQY